MMPFFRSDSYSIALRNGSNPYIFNLSGFAKFVNCQAIATQQGGQW